MIKLNGTIENGERRAVRFGAYDDEVRVLPRGDRFEIALPGLVDDYPIGMTGTIGDDAMVIVAVAKSTYLRRWVVVTVEPLS